MKTLTKKRIGINENKIDFTIPLSEALKNHTNEDGTLTEAGVEIATAYYTQPSKKIQSNEPIANLNTGETVSEVATAYQDWLN